MFNRLLQSGNGKATFVGHLFPKENFNKSGKWKMFVPFGVSKEKRRKKM